MKMLIGFLTCFVVLCSGCGKGDGESREFIAGRPIPACFDINNKKVNVKTTQSKEGGPAFSTMSSGLPTIFFNEQFMQTIAHSAAMVMFVYEHECGHHALGHIQGDKFNHGDISQKSHFKQELEADCYAAQQLKAMGYSSANITAVIDDVYPWPKDPEHPSGKVRSRHVEECFKAAGE